MFELKWYVSDLRSSTAADGGPEYSLSCSSADK